jgi:Uma2 family endonuclease
MEILVKGKLYSVEEYFAIEEKSEVRHEFIHGQLFEMPGGSKIHNKIISILQRILEDLLSHSFHIYRETLKCKIFGEDKYFYPDLIITDEPEMENEMFCCYAPTLLVEVTSDSTLKTDTIDKLIAYQKIPSLQYYLIVNPQLPEIAVFSKAPIGGWLSEAYTLKEDIIPLPGLGIEISLGKLYE